MKLQVIQAGNIPGVDFSNGVQMLPGGVSTPQMARNDNAALFFPQELTQITNTKIREVYRPLKWRANIPVESVQSWANQIEDRKIASQMEDPILASSKGPTLGIPMPSFSVNNQFLPVYEFLVGYGITDREIELGAKVGFGIQEENVYAVSLAVENFLEKIASVGLVAPALKGLGNLVDFTVATATTKASPGAATTWTATSTQDELVRDLHTICNTMEIASKENQECNLILLPLANYQLLTLVSSATFERSALARFRAERPGVEIRVWNKLVDQGTGVTPCAIGLDTRDPFRPKMLMQKELTFGAPLRGINGYIVPGKIATGGVRAINPTAVVKMSGI